MKKTILLIFLILLFSCTKDNDSNTSNQAVSSLEDKLDFGKFTNYNIHNNLSVNWESANSLKVGEKKIIDISVEEMKKTKIKSDIFQEERKYKILVINETPYFIEVFSSKKNAPYLFDLNNVKNFAGTLNVFDLHGVKLGTVGVNNGNAVSDRLDNTLADIISIFNAEKKDSNITSRIPLCNENWTTTVMMSTYVDYYDVWTTASGVYITTTYSHTEYISTENIQMTIPYDCGPLNGKPQLEQHYRTDVPRVTYTSEVDFLNAFNSVSTDGTVTYDSTETLVQAKVRYKMLPWCGIDLYINQKVGNPYTITTVGSDAYGMTVGYEWEQTTYITSVSGDVTSVKVDGLFKYVLFLEGIGSLYSKPMSFYVTINNKTGHIIAANRLP
jgi:hypothetical protein